MNWLQDCIDIKLLITINTSESDRICNHSNCSSVTMETHIYLEILGTMEKLSVIILNV